MRKRWNLIAYLEFLVLLPFLLSFGVLSANRNLPQKEGRIQSVLVEDNVHIYKDSLVVINAAGYAEPATDAAGKKFIGVAYEECDNTLTGHAQGGKSVRVQRDGVYKMPATSIAITSTGARMYAVDDGTIDETSTHGVFVGVLAEYVSSTLGWVDIRPAVFEATTMTKIIGVAPHACELEDAGWTEDLGGLAMDQNISAKDVTVPIHGLQVGDVITKIHMHGAIGAGAGTATVLDCSLYKAVGGAGAATLSSVQAMDQVSKEADYAVDEEKALATPETITAGEMFYFFITGTCANNAACDILVTGLEVEVTRTIR